MRPIALLLLATVAQNPTPEVAAPQAPAAPTADAPALSPGVLPADTSPAARERWKLLLAALAIGGGDAAPAREITAFDLQLQVRVWSAQEGGSLQENMTNLRYRYLRPGFVRTSSQETGVESMRGPDGDWSVDPEKKTAFPLTGQDFAQDRRQLAQTLSIARNYMALADPAKIRIARLEVCEAPDGLPGIEELADATANAPLVRAKQLAWLRVQSPDFQVVEPLAGKGPPMYWAHLGLDPASHLPLLAVIWQDDNGTRAAETALLVDLVGSEHFKTIDGVRVPTYLRVHDPRLPSSPFRFEAQRRVAVIVKPKQSSLAPKLTSEDFRPPRF